MAQAVAERVQEEQYAEEEAVGGPQMLESLQVRFLEGWGGPEAHRGPGLAAPDAGCDRLPLQELGVPAADIKKLKEGGEQSR